jgi:hypothetical protein
LGEYTTYPGEVEEIDCRVRGRVLELLSHPIPKPFTKNGKEDVFDETRVFIDLNYPY